MNFDFSETIIRKIYLKRFCRCSRMASCVGKFSLFATANLRLSGDRSDEET